MIPLLFFLLLQQGPVPYTGPYLPQDQPLERGTLVYPAEAKSAHIQGIVHLEISVDSTGHVTAARALDGPEALRPAAVEAYQHARYRPLLKDGKPVPVVITTAVDFTLNEAPPSPADTLDNRFQAQHATCQQLSINHDPGALQACLAAVETAKAFAPDAELEARAAAYNDLVLLLIADGKKSTHLPEAGRYADQAVNLVAGSTVHQPAIAVAYITRAEVRSLAGNLKGAAADCAIAEETLQTLMADEAENEKAAGYRGQMRELIELHAIILEREGKRDQAKALRQRGTLLAS